MQFAWGYAPTLAIEAAVRHGVFDLLDQGPKGVEEIAKATGTSIRGMRAILNLLVSLELLARTDARYGLAPESAAFLVSTKPGYHGMFFHHISDQLLPRWMQLPEIVRTGKPVATVNDQSEGAAFFAEFVESLFPISFAAATALGEHLGIPKAAAPVSVLDIGAGSGVWGIALAKLSAQVRDSSGGLAASLGSHAASCGQARGSGPAHHGARRLRGCGFWAGAPRCDHWSHSAQRRTGAQPATDRKGIRGAGAGRHYRNSGICAERRTHRTAGHADLRREHAGEHGGRRYFYIFRNERVVARRRFC